MQRGPVPQRVRPGELRHAVGAAGAGHVRRPRPPRLGLRQQVRPRGARRSNLRRILCFLIYDIFIN